MQTNTYSTQTLQTCPQPQPVIGWLEHISCHLIVVPGLGQQTCPVQVLWGADDPWIPLERGARLAHLLGDVPFTPIKGLGHLPQLEDPARVADHLLTALTEREAA